MASYVRLAARQGCRLLSQPRALRSPTIQQACFISTSKKKTDAATIPEAVKGVTDSESQTGGRLIEKEENWISYGYDAVDREHDEHSHFMYLFLGITLTFCWGGFILAYQPDNRLKDWAQREAYLELSKREKEGLPLIDGNLIPPDQIELPSDEELGEFEIVV